MWSASASELSPFVLACVSASSAASSRTASGDGSEEVAVHTLLPPLLLALRSTATALPAASSEQLWSAQCASALCVCSLAVSGAARDGSWRVEALSSALSALLSLHRSAHCQRVGETDCASYVSCRRHLCRLLAARSADLEPLARRTLSASQCRAVLTTAEALYFPQLHLSQLTQRRSAQLVCLPVDQRRAQQPNPHSLSSLDSATEATAECAAATIAAGSASGDGRSGDSQRATDAFPPSEVAPLSALSSPAAVHALSSLEAQFSDRLQRLQLVMLIH